MTSKQLIKEIFNAWAVAMSRGMADLQATLKLNGFDSTTGMVQFKAGDRKPMTVSVHNMLEDITMYEEFLRGK